MFPEILTVLAAAMVVGAVRHEMRLYSQPNLQGKVTIVTSKQPNLTGNDGSTGIAVRATKSFCYVGCWDSYNAEYYKDWYGRLGWTKDPVCFNIVPHAYSMEPWNLMRSLGYFGPEDSSIPTLSVTEDSGPNGYIKKWIGGREITANYEQPLNNVPFTPSYIVITGNQSWTGYSNNDFTGGATCFVPRGEYVIHNFLAETVYRPMLSFAPGCDPSDGRIQKTQFLEVYHDSIPTISLQIALDSGWIMGGRLN